MPAISVILRPRDDHNLDVIERYLVTKGVFVGKPTVSQCVRFALDFTAHQIRRQLEQAARVAEITRRFPADVPSGDPASPPPADASGAPGNPAS